jgi:hypothetical protein
MTSCEEQITIEREDSVGAPVAARVNWLRSARSNIDPDARASNFVMAC